MAHHGQGRPPGFPEEDPGAIKKLMDAVADAEADAKTAFGDTGRYPQGALSKDDEGELRFGVTTHNGKVVLNFGKPVEWIGFDADQAIEIAQQLIKRAGEIKGVPMTLRIGRS